MKQCKRCGSYAVNDGSHGREKDVDLDLCDVCYWRTRFESSVEDTKCQAIERTKAACVAAVKECEWAGVGDLENILIEDALEAIKNAEVK